MLPPTAKLIEQHIHLIEQEAFYDLYAEANPDYTYDLTESLWQAGIDPLKDSDTLFENFLSWSKMRTYTIPSTIEIIGKEAFGHCRYLTSITLSPNIKSIADRAIKTCDELTSITLPPKVEIIGKAVFEHCRSLKRVELNEHLKFVGSWTFASCDELEHVVMYPNITHLPDSMFFECDKLKEIIFKGTVEQWDSIDKHEYWCDDTLKTIRCLDGIVTLNN